MDWVLPALSLVVGIAGGVIGAFVGVRVAVGKLEERMRVAEAEIEKLRIAKHEHAQFLTRHELDIEGLKRK
jgi:uncharacterized membrane-anchored protein YhcB (DUF1043 family)